MKKITAVILTLILCFSCGGVCFASDKEHATFGIDTPIIYIAGDSLELGYDNGTKNFSIDSFFDLFKSEEDGSSKGIEAAVNILKPLALEGILHNDWDGYYEAVYNELRDATGPVLLDGNGDPCTDCTVCSYGKDLMEYERTTDLAQKNPDGLYHELDYRFYYDWRLDPRESVEALHDFIEDIMAVTHKDEVCIEAKCLGSNVLLAYLDRYGTEHLKGVAVSVPTSLGAEFLGGVLSGGFGLDGNSIERFLRSHAAADNILSDPLELGMALLSALDDSGIFDGMTLAFRKLLYNKIESGILSAISRATFMTFPGYWGMVSYEKFDDCVDYIFGEPGSACREEYAGLIEKITSFNEEIKKNALSIFGTLKENSVNTAIISKYGIQLVPVLHDGNVLGDEYVSVAHSSLGATTADVYGTLSDEYIAEREALGLGKYISPDKKIDASTCLFPDSTWFFRDDPHAFDSHEEGNIILSVMAADRQLTVDDFELGQFILCHKSEGYCEKMTEDNCGDSYLGADYAEDHPQSLREYLASLKTNSAKLIKAFIAVMRTYVLPKLRELADKMREETTQATSAATM